MQDETVANKGVTPPLMPDSDHPGDWLAWVDALERYAAALIITNPSPTLTKRPQAKCTP